MKRRFWLVVVLSTAAILDRAIGAEISNGHLATAWAEHPACDPWVDYNCALPKISPATLRAMERSGNCDPYLDYKCLDAYLGNDFLTRFYRYYALEWGHDGPPTDPKAPPSRRADADWPVTPQSTPPMPFTEWPYGGTTAIGVTRPGSVDSPLMVALGNTQLGVASEDGA